VVSFTRALSAAAREVDILVENAGMWPRAPRLSAQGFELAFASNALGHLLLRLRLARLRLMRAGARIVVVTGDAYILAADCTSDFKYGALLSSDASNSNSSSSSSNSSANRRKSITSTRSSMSFTNISGGYNATSKRSKVVATGTRNTSNTSSAASDAGDASSVMDVLSLRLFRGNMQAYCRSKLGVNWLFYEFWRRHGEAAGYCMCLVHPGVADTGLSGQPALLLRGLRAAGLLCSRSAAAQTSLICCCAPRERLVSGGYYHNTCKSRCTAVTVMTSLVL
jgi:NAD(P)-dependent dehydrogenase (short-subunit alcohol dehydrogenase family)